MGFSFFLPILLITLNENIRIEINKQIEKS